MKEIANKMIVYNILQFLQFLAIEVFPCKLKKLRLIWPYPENFSILIPDNHFRSFRQQFNDPGDANRLNLLGPFGEFDLLESGNFIHEHFVMYEKMPDNPQHFAGNSDDSLFVSFSRHQSFEEGLKSSRRSNSNVSEFHEDPSDMS